MEKIIKTSESVTEGHPDKVSDLIADAILDACLKQDIDSRVACEVMCSTGFVVVSGEITTKANINYAQVTRDTLLEIGYTDDDAGFNANTCDIFVYIDKQSEDISLGVNESIEYKSSTEKDTNDYIGAGDQGIMFGYACDETEEYMPMAIYFAHKLTKRLTQVRKNKTLPYLLPDGKAQVSIEYFNEKPIRVDTIVVSAQHKANIEIEMLRENILNYVIKETIPPNLIDVNTNIFINPTGRFVIGGPAGDCGVTGRKIIADTYGGYCPHGGGAFSGKDPSKVDRSAAYMARYICKNIVASGLARKCQISVAYCIGKAQPVAINVETFGTSKFTNEEIMILIKKNYDLRPQNIINFLSLMTPIYKTTTNYGHFGKSELKWEKINKIFL